MIITLNYEKYGNGDVVYQEQIKLKMTNHLSIKNVKHIKNQLHQQMRNVVQQMDKVQVVLQAHKQNSVLLVLHLKYLVKSIMKQKDHGHGHVQKQLLMDLKQ